MQWRTGFNYDRDQASLEAGLSIDPGEKMTQEQFAKEADINEIVRRFGITGQLPTNLAVPLSGEFVEVSDFKSAMDAVMAAQDEFMRLPGEVRARFGNDPGQLIAFLEDPGNRAEAEQLGLVNKPAEVTRDEVKPA